MLAEPPRQQQPYAPNHANYPFRQTKEGATGTETRNDGFTKLGHGCSWDPFACHALGHDNGLPNAFQARRGVVCIAIVTANTNADGSKQQRA